MAKLSAPLGKGRRDITPLGWALRGAAAGAAGTAALNAVTYLDMAIRGRPSSSTPEQVVETIADKAHVSIPGDSQARGAGGTSGTTSRSTSKPGTMPSGTSERKCAVSTAST